jgi:hypothetical protein
MSFIAVGLAIKATIAFAKGISVVMHGSITHAATGSVAVHGAAHGAAVASLAAQGTVHVTTAHAMMAGGAVALTISTRTMGSKTFAESVSRLLGKANGQVQRGARPALTGRDISQIVDAATRNSEAELRAAGVLAPEDDDEIASIAQLMKERFRG